MIKSKDGSPFFNGLRLPPKAHFQSPVYIEGRWFRSAPRADPGVGNCRTSILPEAEMA